MKKLFLHSAGTGTVIALVCLALYINRVPPTPWIKFTVITVGVFTIIIQEWSDVAVSAEPEDLDGLLVVLSEIVGVLSGLLLSMLYWR